VAAPGHWVEWHERYADPDSALSRRLLVVQRRLSDAFDAAAPGPIRLVSMCAGQGRDVIGVLGEHDRGADVVALLVELDPDLASDARSAAAAAGLAGVTVVQGDASTTSTYAGAVPADVVMVCGVFGNVVDDDVRRTVQELPCLCAPEATVIWTRHRREPDLTPTVRAWFTEAGFVEVAFDGAPGSFGVGTHRLVAPPQELRAGRRMFTFVGDGADAHH